MKTFEEYIIEAKRIKLGPAVFKLTDTEKYKGETIEYYDNTGKYKEAFSVHVNHKDKTVSVYQNMGDEYQSSEEWMDDWFKKKGLTKKYEDDRSGGEKYQKMFEKLSGNKSLMVIDKRGKEYSWEDGSRYGIVVMDRHDRTDSLKHKEIERLEIR